jgi:chaperone required for assembly of F1-ATPase
VTPLPRGKRRFRQAAVEALPAGYRIALDGKPLMTPAGAPLQAASQALAEAVAAEWRALGEEIDPARLPLTRLLGSAIDLVGPNRAELVARTADYAGTDLLCYRAEAPPGLAERQHAGWQPLLDWAALRFEARLRVTAGVLAVPQPGDALEALRRAVEAYDDLRLTALAAATATCGSLILGLALAEGRLDAEGAWALSQLDEIYQSELWGEDAEAARRRAALKDDIAAAARFLALLAV